MEKTCQTCAYFRQHYVKFGSRYDPTASGHCVHPRSKLRRAETPACWRYREKPGS